MFIFEAYFLTCPRLVVSEVAGFRARSFRVEGLQVQWVQAGQHMAISSQC